jgi:hypothetical protein
MGDFRYWQFFLCGSGRKRDGRLDVLRFQTGKIGKDFLRGIACGQAGKYSA